MSEFSNNNGRAYEFACLMTLYEAISNIRPAKIVENSSFDAAKEAWDSLDEETHHIYLISAGSTIDTIFAMEPNIVEVNDDILLLYIQPDKKGEVADIRDIIIERKDIIWEIGLSIKHNHEAVKHSRLAKTLDFGNKWYNIPCSDTYWDEVSPVFNLLEEEKNKGSYFRDLDSKENDVYEPLLKAFIKEIKTQVGEHRDVPKKLVQYLLSNYDFYKVISFDTEKVTTIQSFNMFGTLNRPSRISEPQIKTRVIKLPSQLLYIDFMKDPRTKKIRKNTVIMCFDNGWQFSFRIHNAKDLVETSLKFDIQIVGMPAEVDIKYICKWQNN